MGALDMVTCPVDLSNYQIQQDAKSSTKSDKNKTIESDKNKKIQPDAKFDSANGDKSVIPQDNACVPRSFPTLLTLGLLSANAQNEADANVEIPSAKFAKCRADVRFPNTN